MERLVLVAARFAILAVEFAQPADLSDGQIEAGLPQGIKFLPSGRERPLLRHSKLVIDRQAHGISPAPNIPGSAPKW